MEYLVFQRLWRWSKRRHPQKNTDWVKQKYFHAVGERSWVFGAPVVRDDGSKGLLELYQISGTVIRRHKKIKGDFTPFDPMWEQYGEQLRQERLWESMRYRKQWAS